MSADRSPHSAPMNVVRAAFEQLGWNMTPVNTLEEQLETAKDNSPTIGAAYLRLKEQLEALKMQERANARAFEDSEREIERLREQLETLQGVANGVIWLDNNIHNYGSDGWRGYFKAVLRDARAALASSPANHPTLDDRNPASVVGVPWNEEGYAGGESSPAISRECEHDWDVVSVHHGPPGGAAETLLCRVCGAERDPASEPQS